eukprot:6214260-Pleurochrysis_carterae.AAC.5
MLGPIGSPVLGPLSRISRQAPRALALRPAAQRAPRSRRESASCPAKQASQSTSLDKASLASTSFAPSSVSTEACRWDAVENVSSRCSSLTSPPLPPPVLKDLLGVLECLFDLYRNVESLRRECLCLVHVSCPEELKYCCAECGWAY